ncbi:MAG: tRNA (N6-threonylcarbamoyladenosine(37)-N6)-methyltransferase TrmO [Planctomycetota bacterium]|jgi:tRNA-Thr(GGU) m(6)t(6)A37 methyltransferase TsaA
MDLARRHFAAGALANGIALCTATGNARSRQGSEGQKVVKRQHFEVYPIGHVERRDGYVRLRILEAYEPALVGLKDFSHAHVFWWFDRNDTPEKRGILQVHPRGDRRNPLTGVFATRAPVRPNLIAMNLCAIRAIRGGLIAVDKIDAFDGTPVLDIKPYIPTSDTVAGEVRVPEWL